MSPDYAAWTLEIFSRYGELLSQHRWSLALQALLGLGLTLLLWRSRSPRLRWALSLGALGLGLSMAIVGASAVDDAFISLRYAHNLLAGDGLVWNPGERVEGYTNFLWTLALAAGMWLLPIDPPLIAVALCLAAHVANVLLLVNITRPLGIPTWTPPVAAMLYAVQGTATEYATTGLETGASVTALLLGLRLLLREEQSWRGAWSCSLAFVVAMLLRPDNALFWGSAALASVLLSPTQDRLKLALGWGLGLLPYGLVLLWKLSYYGSIVPNTYYAKSANLWYPTQGWIYLLSFVLGAQLWLLMAAALPALLGRGRPLLWWRFALYAGLSLLLFNVYVIKVGGDFMYGRFYLVTLPLWLILAELGLGSLLAQGRLRRALGVSALLGLSAVGLPIVEGTSVRWWLAKEGDVYPIVRWWPELEVGHNHYVMGHLFRERFTDRGLRPVLATSGIGMVGYYSGLEIVDILGLTDARVARRPLNKRRRPGHEKRAKTKYLYKRGVLLLRSEEVHPERWREVTSVRLRRGKQETWALMRYDRAELRVLSAMVPEMRIEPFEPALDAWLGIAKLLEPGELLVDAGFVERYYLRWNEDPVREAAVEELVVRAREVMEAAEAAKSSEAESAP